MVATNTASQPAAKAPLVNDDFYALLDAAERTKADVSVWAHRTPGALDTLLEWASRRALTVQCHRHEPGFGMVTQMYLVQPHGDTGCDFYVHVRGEGY